VLEVLATPPLNSVQDVARSGFRRIGLCQGGAMDDLALSLANALLGNPVDAAAIEIQTFPFRVRATSVHRIALTGADCDIRLGDSVLPSQWVARMEPGETLTIGRPRSGARAYLGVAGGVDVEPVLGSRSTDLRCGFGGFRGRALQAGDLIACGGEPEGVHAWDFGVEPPSLALPLDAAQSGDHRTVRVVAGPEYEEFGAASQAAFWETDWSVTTMSDRMGSRLAGAKLWLKQHRELRSGGIVPGVIQTPPSGEPLIQMRDANSAGGYPRIGVVIRADLWRVAQSRPSATLRFLRVSPEQAVEAERRKRAYVDSVRARAARISTLQGAAKG
jgi:biotin-dependent carboxylase-like uncharacterized protein